MWEEAENGCPISPVILRDRSRVGSELLSLYRDNINFRPIRNPPDEKCRSALMMVDLDGQQIIDYMTRQCGHFW